MAYFDLEEYGDFSVVRFFLGHIGLEYLEEIEEQLASVCATAGGDIVLDMSEVESVTPEVLHYFNRLRGSCQERGRELAMAAPGPAVVAAIRKLEPTFALPLYGTLDQAFQKQPVGSLPAAPPPKATSAQGYLFCDRSDCVFNQPMSPHDARRVCTHEYAQMIGNPKNCKYYRMNWVEVSEETKGRLEGQTKGSQPAAPEPASPPASAPIRTVYEIDHAQGPLDHVAAQAPSHAPTHATPSAPSPAEPAVPAELPSVVVKRYIEASNSMDFWTECDCLAPAMVGGTREEYVKRRREVYANLAKTGPVPQYFFLRLFRENVIVDAKATVECMRAEVDSLGRRELRQIYHLARIGGPWKITSISSGGPPPRPALRTPRTTGP